MAREDDRTRRLPGSLEYDIERKFRECKLSETAPVNNNLILAYLSPRVHNTPRSY